MSGSKEPEAWVTHSPPRPLPLITSLLIHLIETRSYCLSLPVK